MDSGELRRRFGAHVQRLREARGLTQEQLADRISRSVDTVGNIERGVNGTRLETGYALARALGIGAGELFDVAAVPRLPIAKRRKAVEQLLQVIDGLDDRSLAQLKVLVEAALRLAHANR
ncbi:MAG TPA: helix-turn-helix transcriptional regulator [Bryobacteraceae bacterium]|jgi:transcriptional regulator with XRE-family HTH domain